MLNHSLLGKINGTSLFVIFIALICAGTAPPIEVKISELFTCRGPDLAGEPTEITETFLSTDRRVFACGKLQTNYKKIFLAVNWLYEGQPIFHDELEVTSGYFYSHLPVRQEPLSTGTYQLKVVVGNRTVQELTFQIEAP